MIVGFIALPEFVYRYLVLLLEQFDLFLIIWVQVNVCKSVPLVIIFYDTDIQVFTYQIRLNSEFSPFVIQNDRTISLMIIPLNAIQLGEFIHRCFTVAVFKNFDQIDCIAADSRTEIIKCIVGINLAGSGAFLPDFAVIL